MTLEIEYNNYVQKCKKLLIYPLAYTLWLADKTKRQTSKNKFEIGYDLNKSHTGNPVKGTAWSTSEGECLK